MSSHVKEQTGLRSSFLLNRRFIQGAALGAILALFAGAASDKPMAGAASVERGPRSVADIAEKLQGAVVNISTEQAFKGVQNIPTPRTPQQGAPLEDFFEDFLDRQQRGDGSKRVSSLGSGFVIDPRGIVITNNHVIEGADDIYVNFPDGSKLKVVEIIGKDIKIDLAVLRVEPKKPLQAVPFGDSGKMRVGDWVMAVGNPFGLGGSVTVGILSATRRDINAGPYDEFLQTDAAINRGNSGGPLFNMDGEVIGINTAIISPTGGSIGIGFAVPSNTVAQVVEQLRKYGETRRGWLGVRIQTVGEEIAESLGLPQTGGALIASVTPDGPAAKAGLKVGDIITKFDGMDISELRGLPRIVAQTEVGKQVEIRYWREGERKVATARIERLDEGEAPPKVKKTEAKPNAQFVMGLALAPMSDELRARFDIDKSVNGVVVTEVDPSGEASDKSIKPGDVILEVTNEKVATPAEFARRVRQLREMKRKTALLLLADATGSMNFITVPIQK
ncbi:MAG: Do family serine endopeptidase [Hyphomicrobiales bacterium]|nr:Do family serine endopeptidase [Hyphomicrobiales bacterium]